MSRAAVNKIQPQWWRKTLIGCLGSLSLAYALIALFAWFGPGGIDAETKVQVNMWLITPIWLTLFSLSYLFISWRTALLKLGLANVLAWGMFVALRFGLQELVV